MHSNTMCRFNQALTTIFYASDNNAICSVRSGLTDILGFVEKRFSYKKVTKETSSSSVHLQIQCRPDNGSTILGYNHESSECCTQSRRPCNVVSCILLRLYNVVRCNLLRLIFGMYLIRLQMIYCTHIIPTRRAIPNRKGGRTGLYCPGVLLRSEKLLHQR